MSVILPSVPVENLKAGSVLRDHLVHFFPLALGSLRPGEGQRFASCYPGVEGWNQLPDSASGSSPTPQSFPLP